MTIQMPVELVLPSGRFVTFRRPTLEDMLQAMACAALAGKDKQVFMAQVVLLSRVATVDGQVLKPEDWLAMDAEESWPAYNASIKIYQLLDAGKGGVA